MTCVTRGGFRTQSEVHAACAPRSHSDIMGNMWVVRFALAIVPGLPLYKTHRYHLVTEYDNPTDKDVDAMAALSRYVRKT